MLKKTVTYTDFFGDQHTEDFYFHLTKVELSEIALEKGDLFDRMRHIAENQESTKGHEVISLFKDMLLAAYGERSEDGKRFIKDDQRKLEFSQTAAFDDLLHKLCTYEEDPVEFIKAILPPDIAKQAEEQMAKQQGLPQDFKKKVGE